jgi:hypothetical protein
VLPGLLAPASSSRPSALAAISIPAGSLDPIAPYLGHSGLTEGWLVMFDLRKELPWTDRLFVREAEHAATKIRIVGC